MTVIPPPPEGWELVPSDDEDDLSPESTRFRAPDGEVVKYTDMVLAGLFDEQ